MTRKDYRLIAKAIAEAKDMEIACKNERKGVPAVKSTARTIASYLACDNPRFDRERFLTACGVYN